MSEMNQGEMRKTNIIIHNLLEPQVEGASSKDVLQEKEHEILGDLFAQMELDKEEIKENIKFCKRLGEKKDGKGRPLLVGFKNVNKRNKVMEAAISKRNLPSSLTSDLTKMQRDENDKLRKEVQNLNNEKPSDNSGDYRWNLVGPPEMLRKVKVRDIGEWERKEAIRNQRKITVTKRHRHLNPLLEEAEEDEEAKEEEEA